MICSRIYMNDKQNIQNLQNFAEVEFMIDQYFDKHLQKLVDKGYKDLRDKQSVELAQSYKEKSSRFMADPSIAMQQAMIEVNNSGKWNTKHTVLPRSWISGEIALSSVLEKPAMMNYPRRQEAI